MKRKIEDILFRWKGDDKRKPLLLIGARQTGKTYIMQHFGEAEFDSTILIDFEKNQMAKTIFEGNLDPDDIISQVEMFAGQRFVDGKTLLIFDEIQACPKAITSLKYFAESPRNLHVIGAGSLLGVALDRNDFSFPVGKVKTIRLYPMDFEEFLEAIGEPALIDLCRSCFKAFEAVPKALHERLLSLYRTYLVVGGMPEVVSIYSETKSYAAAQEKQADILSDYRSDIAKYADSSKKVLAQRAFDTIPMQLAKENRKFQYNLIRKGATSALFGEPIEWLCSAGIALRCSRITTPEIPLSAYEDLSSFKLYALDSGLLVQMSGMPKESILNELGERFMGGLTENYVATQLMANGFPLYYWTSNGDMEIDFLFQLGTDVTPVEVKASERVRSRSLSGYIKEYKPYLSIRISTRNIGYSDGILSFPLYMVWLIPELKPEDIVDFLAPSDSR